MMIGFFGSGDMYVMRSLSGVEGNAGARFGFGSTMLTDLAQRAGITYYVTTTRKGLVICCDFYLSVSQKCL